MATAERACARLCDPAHEVSAHYLISKAGHIQQLVPEDRRAWHAGAGRWGDVMDVNSHSIGVELDNDGQGAFAEPLMGTLMQLLPQIMQRHDIPPERVIGHSDVAPARKGDPGALFDWARLADAGLAIAADFAQARRVSQVSATRFYTDLATIGYDPTAPRGAQLDAFRLRHNRDATGAETADDATVARDLAHRFPVDRTLR